MNRVFATLATSLLPCVMVGAQEPAAPPPGQTPPAPDSPPAPDPAPSAEEPWTFSFEAYTFTVPDDHSYVQPIVTADRGLVHLEARWNYEDLDTASLWFGCNFAFGDEVAVEVTPMIGAVFGETNGVAPGYAATIGWWRLEAYSEGEYLFDTSDHSDSFFYNWSELTFSVTDWLRAGCVVQRTQVYQTDLDTQRGLMAGVSLDSFDVTAYVFNPDESEPVFVVAAGLSL